MSRVAKFKRLGSEYDYETILDEGHTLATCDDYVHCYLLGPGRHHTWTGDSFEQCLDRCEPEIRKWISEAQS